METQVGFHSAGKVSDTVLPPAGIEFAACPRAGLPVRPKILPLQPIQFESSEELSPKGESSSPSASSRLAEALQKEPTSDETNPVEARLPRKAVTPEDPTEEERESHQLTGHACFRSWCRHCVRGRGTEAAHRSSVSSSNALPVISWDYYYLSALGGEPERAES